MKKFTDKLFLISGAAHGIGRLMALEFSRKGALIALADINLKGAEKVRDEIRSESGSAEAFKVDISDQNSILKLKEAIHQKMGKVDALVNNAGIVHGGVFEEIPLKKHVQTYQVNTIGLVSMTHVFLPDMLQSNDAHIVNIASASGMIPLPFGATYASSKWATIGFSESIRLELKEQKRSNIKITTVSPSYINTGMFDGVQAPLLVPILQPEKVVQKIVNAVEKNRSRVQEPMMVKFIDLLKGILPQKIFDYACSKLGISSSMLHWQGHQE